MKNKEKELYIPMNALDRQDLISGFGKHELKIAVIVFAVCLVGCVIAITKDENNTFAAIVVVVGIMGFVISAIWRDQHDESMVEKVRQLFVYITLQKKYEYHYDDWLEKYIGGQERYAKTKENRRTDDSE